MNDIIWCRRGSARSDPFGAELSCLKACTIKGAVFRQIYERLRTACMKVRTAKGVVFVQIHKVPDSADECMCGEGRDFRVDSRVSVHDVHESMHDKGCLELRFHIGFFLIKVL